MKTYRVLIFIIFIIFFLPTASFSLIMGPFTGKVVDSQTGDPIEGANVLVYLEGHFPVPPEGYDKVLAVKMVYTNKAGRYEIPATVVPLDLLSLYEDTRLIIYQPGYQAHIAWQDSGRPSSSFKKSGYIVKLDRIPPNFNYKAHGERIAGFLGNIEPYGWEDPIWGKKLTWEERIKLNLKCGIIEKEELLRRVHWEWRRIEEERR